MVDVFGPLSARPPTPPRTSSRALPEKDRTEDSPVVAQTPGLSPFATNASNGVPSSRQSKRVNFSPWTKYIKPPSFANAANTISKPKSDLKTLPPSNECKPSKSILKPTNSPAPVKSPKVTSHTPESFVMLLKSMASQLAGSSPSSRLDAYMQLFGALRTYEGLPGEQEVAECLGLITQFIQRDISRVSENVGPLDTNLRIQALKLSAALMWQTNICAQLSDDFKIFLTDHSINILHDSKVPKSVLTHHMTILSTQNFSPKIMNNARLSRLLTVLHDLTNRVTGNSIVSHRLSIYGRVLNQAKSLFVSQSLLWMDHLISGLLHPIKDIRIKAISLGFQVSMIFGPNPTLSKSIQDIFDRSLDKGRKLVTEICERMARMMSNSDSGVHVPQVWSVVILLLRNKRLNVDDWNHFKEWVLVLQKCFNCSDSSIKAQAIVAWNRFVLVVSPGEMTNRPLLRMLSKPILSQFERKKQDKSGSPPSQLVMCSYYNLLYYAFRPSASFQHLDIVWEEYIASPSSKTFSSSSALSDRLAHILSNMLWSPQTKIWSENKVNDTNKLEPEELPTLDCRWIRSRITSVLKVFENIFRTSLWAENIEQSNIAIAWIRLSKALSNASSKEITPSSESMQTVAHVLGLLQRLWKAGPSSINAVEKESMDTFFERFQFLSRSMIFSLGNTPFTEKLLLKNADATFQAANTPTHRHSHSNSNLDSPVLHFLRLVSDVSGISEPSPAYLRLINSTLEAACNGRTSRSSRLELLRQCAELHSNETTIQLGVHSFAQIVWRSVAHLAADSVCSYPIETARERDGSVSRDYENTVKILSTGLRFADVFQVWDELLGAFVRVIRTEKGDREIASMVVEPLAECLMAVPARDRYLASASLFKHSLSMTYGVDGKEPEYASHLSARENLPVPKKLLELVDKTLQISYQEFDATDTNGIADFIESLTSFLGSGFTVFRSRILETLQQPLTMWLKDETHKLNVESGVESRVLTAGRALSSAVLNILQASSPHDSLCLQRFEGIICAGLESSHASVAKKFLEFCKSSFVAQSSSPYSEAISRAVQRLETQADTHERPSDPQAGKDRRADMSEKSRIAFILDNSSGPSSTGFNSSPVTRAPEVLDAPEDLSKEAQDESLPANDDTPDEPNGAEVSISFEPAVENPPKRSELFSMIENLRSSSPPTNTPRELGFMTPPHLRSLRNLDREAETPQTPTLPAIAADNDEGFLGSSPTPGTRDRPQTSGSTLRSSLVAPAMASDMDIDPPSSPPDIRSQSPNSRSKSAPMEGSTSRDRSAKAKRKKQRRKERRSKASRASSPVTQPDPPATPKELGETEVTAQPERPPSSRTRSSAGKVLEDTTEESSAGIHQDPEQSTQAQSTSDDQDIVIEDAPSQEAPEIEVGGDHDETRTEDHDIPDSSSDDMETQIASQLEQDLEFAVVDEADEQSNNPPVTRKRKREAREATFSTPSNQERRRSSRLSTTTKEHPATEGTEPKSTRSKKSKTPSQIEKTASSPAEGGPLKRRRHSKGSVDNEEPKFALPEQNSSVDADQPADSLETSSQKRRSNRLSGHVAPASVAETPLPKKSSRRKQSTKQKEATPTAPQAETPVVKSKSKSKSKSKGKEKEKRKTPERGSVDREDSEIPESSESRINTKQTTQQEVETSQPSEPASPPAAAQQQNQPSPQPQDDTQTTDAVAADPPPTEKTPKTKASGPSKAKQKPKSTDAVPDTNSAPASGEIIPALQHILDNVKAAALDRSALKQIDDLLFDIRVETHEALRRHTG
ncbi:hypothetical protein P170DRAFT_373970 [Aspergillus steynii IBT 23096]|uniref:Telomere-associated protein Rif1 N-terminal domain-containing protein n=1 Tax=Aspergillus steynii IBT 23096 TaxID=1392250 RepID=A0A2I2GP50_9EURO|nr:uncharacterized protein P170DRAFT_373970 [Aspergillus steynii IBT 23096]PLB54649.1 hypothetical protein P170DRAFT_373970 [Aspergillus steynii IBT 23096]